MDRTEETAMTSVAFGRREMARRLLVRACLSVLFLISSLPLGLLWSVVLAVLLLAGLPLTIVWVGLPVLVLAMMVCTLGVTVERWRLASLLNTHLPSPFRHPERGPVLARVVSRAKDPALWRGLLYLFILLPIGLVEFVIVLILATAVSLIVYPLWFWTLPDGQGVMWTGLFVADTLLESFLITLVGLLMGAATLIFVDQVSRVHSALGRLLLGPRHREDLEERVEALTESRSKAVEAAIVERRRIERDLHDGAQQRLVSLAMTLGLARQKLERESNAGDAHTQAAALVGEAHEEAKRALAEIRNLIRGIHPAILTDRGLDAATSALASRSPVPTSVEVGLTERPSEAAEITAYFIIAEALANVARHSGASEAHVSVYRRRWSEDETNTEDLLIVEVEDDGKGGANFGGSGLKGLSDRALVLDGKLIVISPTDGPTKIYAELPWGTRNEE